MIMRHLLPAFLLVTVGLVCNADDHDAVKKRVMALMEAFSKGNLKGLDALISDEMEWYEDGGAVHKAAEGRALEENAYVNSICGIKDRKTLSFDIQEVKSKGDAMCLVKIDARLTRTQGEDVTWKQLQIWEKHGDSWLLGKVKDATPKANLPTVAATSEPKEKAVARENPATKRAGRLTSISGEISQFGDHATGLSALKAKSRQGKKIHTLEQEHNEKLEKILEGE